MSRRYKLPDEYVHVHEPLSVVDKCVPDQSLTIPQLLEKYNREQKPLPEAVDYDTDSLEKEYSDLSIPYNLSKADALHFMDLTKAHMNKLEYHLRTLDSAGTSDVSSERPELSPENGNAVEGV